MTAEEIAFFDRFWTDEVKPRVSELDMNMIRRVVVVAEKLNGDTVLIAIAERAEMDVEANGG